MCGHYVCIYAFLIVCDVCVSHSVMSHSLRPHGPGMDQAPLTMEFSRQESWNGFLFPSLGELLDPGIEPVSPTLQADALPPELLGKPNSI